MLKDGNLVVITPVYEDRKAFGCLLKDLSLEFGSDFFIVAVDDGSIKEPLDISMLSDMSVSGVVLKLRRNVGHQRAIAIGLGYISEYLHEGQRVVIMDSDGEDMPSSISFLLEAMCSEKTDVVVAQRKSRIESLQFKAFYFLYKLFFRVMTGRAIGFGNFMALTAPAVKRLVVMQELSIHVAGAVIASKLRTKACLLDRGPRYAGESKMNFISLILHGFKGLMVFAEDVLIRVGVSCAGIAALAVLGAVAAIVLKIIGYSTPGWFSIALGILVLMFIQTGVLALMTLMLTGVVRGGTVTTLISYQDFIEVCFKNIDVDVDD